MKNRNLVIIFALLFNICHATNNNSFKDKSRFGATFLTAVLNSHRSGANIFMKLIPLSKQGKYRGKYFAMVDDADFENLNKLNWYVSAKKHGVYAYRDYKDRDGKKQSISMHRHILGITQPKKLVDHKNHNGLDNQRSNIRIATYNQNAWNKAKTKKATSSIYLGVHWKKTKNKWCASIGVNGCVKHIGVFDDEIEAAKAFDKAAKEHHKEFANLNFK